MSAASPMLDPVSKPQRKPRKPPVPPPHIRETILWILVALCQLGYPVGPMLAQLGIPVPVNPAHSAPAPQPHSPAMTGEAP